MSVGNSLTFRLTCPCLYLGCKNFFYCNRNSVKFNMNYIVNGLIKYLKLLFTYFSKYWKKNIFFNVIQLSN